jgi:hypothetical protein
MVLIELNIAGRRFTRQLGDRRRPALRRDLLGRQWWPSRAA